MTPAVPAAKFTVGVVDTGGQLAPGVEDTSGAPWLAKISQILEKFEMIPMLFSGAWGKMIMKKTWTKKSCETVSLNTFDVN